jgi:hypothetical protein
VDNRRNANGLGGTRTHTGFNSQRILSPLAADANKTAKPLDHPPVSDTPQDDTVSDLALRLAQLTAKHPDLQHLITAWPDLPDAVKAGITAMVQATTR